MSAIFASCLEKGEQLSSGYWFLELLGACQLKKKGCDRIYCDQSESGLKDNRPEWSNWLGHLGKSDTLVIWELDRASRSTKHLIELVEDLKKHDVELLRLKEQIDTETATAKFFFQMTALIAEPGRDIIREQTLARIATGRKGSRKESITEGQKLEERRVPKTMGKPGNSFALSLSSLLSNPEFGDRNSWSWAVSGKGF